MRVFLSHATADALLARHLKACLTGELGVDVFMMPQDAPPGSEWMDVIRDGARDCDALYTLVTPTSVGRLWIAAEWACFWVQGKPRLPLLVGVGFDDLWDPMQRSQWADLLDPASNRLLIDDIVRRTGAQPTDSIRGLAQAIADEIPPILDRMAVDAADDVARRFVECLRGSPDVRHADVELLARAGRLPWLVAEATSLRTAPVKAKRTGVSLWQLGHHDEALTVTLSIATKAEAKNVGREVVLTMAPTDGADAPPWRFLDGLHPHLRPPQRRELRDLMMSLGITPLGKWSADPDRS